MSRPSACHPGLAARRRHSQRRLAPLLAVCLLPAALAQTQSAYKYRDASGQWVYTDRAAANASAGGVLNLQREPEALHIAVQRTDAGGVTRLVAVNDCLCVVTVRAAILQSDFTEIPKGASYQATLTPGTSQVLIETREHAGGKGELRFAWRDALGPPGAVHAPTHPYRAPFALGSTYTVSQAYPAHITHVTPDSQYAVDFVLPDATPVYAAREGTVINVRHDSFTGAPLPVMLDQANVIEILHADGTIALYAHLHWDSIRVRIGQYVHAGEYIANSGNTGFTTGPHLHFAVWRNNGAANVSVPVQFAGLGGAPVTATTAQPLTAY